MILDEEQKSADWLLLSFKYLCMRVNETVKIPFNNKVKDTEDDIRIETWRRM